MSEAKQKSGELVEMFAPIMPNENWKDRAVECAKLCVNEIMETLDECYNSVPNAALSEKYKEMKEVLTELNKM